MNSDVEEVESWSPYFFERQEAKWSDLAPWMKQHVKWETKKAVVLFQKLFHQIILIIGQISHPWISVIHSFPISLRIRNSFQQSFQEREISNKTFIWLFLSWMKRQVLRWIWSRMMIKGQVCLNSISSSSEAMWEWLSSRGEIKDLIENICKVEPRMNDQKTSSRTLWNSLSKNGEEYWFSRDSTWMSLFVDDSNDEIKIFIW